MINLELSGNNTAGNNFISTTHCSYRHTGYKCAYNKFEV